MRLIQNTIITKLEEDFLLINSLNGLIDVINKETLELINQWYLLDNIVVNDEKELKIYNLLKSRGYLCNSKKEELEKKEQIISSLRSRHSKLNAETKVLTFILTYDCNFRCPYCFENINPKLKNSYMNKELIDAALSLAGESLEHICLFGGEPLLIRNKKAIEYIVSKAPDKVYSAITNGYNLDSFMDIFEKVHVTNIMITLDGDKETHNKRRFLASGEGTFDKIINNIQIALKKGIPIKIRMNLDNSNFSECLKLRKTLVDKFENYLDILSFEMSPIMDIKTLKRNDMFTALYKDDLECVRSYSNNKVKNVMLSRFSPIINSIVNGEKLSPKYSFCFAHESGLMVDPLGYIYPCLISVGKIPIAIGKYYPEVKYFKKSIRTRNIETIKECRDCHYSLLCGGGCPVKLKNYDDLYKPECNSIKYQIHDLLPKFLKVNINNQEEEKNEENQ